MTVQPNPAASVRPESDASGNGAGAVVVQPSPKDLGSPPATTQVATRSGLDPMLLISAAFLLAGISLFLLRWSARRLGDG